MNKNFREGTLKDFLLDAREARLQDGWLYLAESPPKLGTRCLLVAGGEDELDEMGISKAARRKGFAFEGLDAVSIVSVVDGTRRFQDPPPEDLMLEAFLWYLKFDSFLPIPGAPPPPPWEVVQRELDQKFYDALGPEDPTRRCKSPNCSRGQLRLSVYRRAHHFEMIHHRPCPVIE